MSWFSMIIENAEEYLNFKLNSSDVYHAVAKFTSKNL